MERISALIQKLQEQLASGADAEQLLFTTQLLQAELLKTHQQSPVVTSRKISVVMPSVGQKMRVVEEEPVRATVPVRDVAVAPMPVVKDAVPAVRGEEVPSVAKPVYGGGSSSVAAPLRAMPSESVFASPSTPVRAGAPPVKEMTPNDRAAEVRQMTIHERMAEEVIPTAEIKQPELPATTALSKTEASFAPAPVVVVPDVSTYVHPPVVEESATTSYSYNPIQDVPTLTHQLPQQERKELNEQIATEATVSLNEALRNEQQEVASRLTEAPIRDLRKAIGINDRYVFINELFRGDEAMYERSVKTINNFSIYQEAYFWMERELKLKLGWGDEKHAAQLFYQLVRRRFA